MSNEDYLLAAKESFCETITLKLQQLRRVVPKGTNSELTGDFVEELVRGFIKDWISPCQLLSGTMHPHDSRPVTEINEIHQQGFHTPRQIDGIIFDPRLGPPIIKEGGFAVAHPVFCRGVIEIKTSVSSLVDLERRLQQIYHQYFYHYQAITCQVMGIVVQDSDPEKHSLPDWFQRTLNDGTKENVLLYDYNAMPHCPIFILFDNDYNPHLPAIDSMMRTIFKGPLHGSRPGM